MRIHFWCNNSHREYKYTAYENEPSSGPGPPCQGDHVHLVQPHPILLPPSWCTGQEKRCQEGQLHIHSILVAFSIFVYFHFLLAVLALVQWSTLWKQQPNSPWLVYDEIYVWYIATLPIGPNDVLDDEIQAMDKRAIDAGASAKLSSWKMLSAADVWSCRQSAAEYAPRRQTTCSRPGLFPALLLDKYMTQFSDWLASSWAGFYFTAIMIEDFFT